MIAVLALPLALMAAPAIATGSTSTSSTPKPPMANVGETGAALAQAKKENKRVEIESLHSETATYFANPDGKTLTTEFSLDPVRFKQHGAWQPVDTTLVADNGTIKPRATKAGLTLSPGGDTDLLTVKSGRDGSELKVSAPQKLPAPKLSANRAEYANAYGSGIDLVVVATPTGFRQEVVIRRRPIDALKLPIPIQLPDGLSFEETSSGKLALNDTVAKTKRSTTEIPAPMLTDASANLSMGEEGHVGEVATAVEKTAAGQILVYKPDARFLADPDVTYPVTLVGAAVDWTQLPVGNDTFINDSAYQNGFANSGNYHLQAGKTGSGTVRWRTYIRFDDIPADSPLRGAKVTNADLRLWNIDSNDCGESVGSGITARRITQQWDVTTLTWNNQPTVTSTGADTEYGAYKPSCDRGYMNYEWYLIHFVNPIAQEWANGEPNYGFQLTSGNENDHTNWRAYRSKEWVSSDDSHGPKLIIGYEPVQSFFIASWTYSDEEEIDTYEEALAAFNDPARVRAFPSLTTEPPISWEKAYNQKVSSTDTLTTGADDLLNGPQPEEPPPPTPDPNKDTTPPAVVSVTPSPPAVDVPVNPQVTVTFSEPVTDAQFLLTDLLTEGQAAGTIAMSADNKVLTFALAQPLSGTYYMAQVSGAKDAAGNAMAAPYKWQFTTVVRTVSLPAQTDTWIDTQGASGSADPVLRIGAYNAGRTKIHDRTYLAYDTAPLVGKTIVDAKLEMWNTTNKSTGCGNSQSGIKVQRVTAAWNTATLKWSSQPSSTEIGETLAKDPGGCTDNSNPPSNVGWTWSTTDIVKSWASGQSNHGLVLRGADESASGPVYDRGFTATENREEPNSHFPVLQVTYTDSAVANPTPAMTPTPEPNDTLPSITPLEPTDDASANSTPIQKSAAAAAPTPPPAINEWARMTPEKCEQNRALARRTVGWTMNRYSWCTIGKFNLKEIRGAGSTAVIKTYFASEMMLIGYTFNGTGSIRSIPSATTRDVFLDLHVKITTAPLPVVSPYTLKMGVMPADTECDHVRQWDGNTHHNNLAKPLGQWTTGDSYRFLLRCPEANADAKRTIIWDQEDEYLVTVDNTEKATLGRFKAYGEYPDLPLVLPNGSKFTTNVGNNEATTFIQCDSASYIYAGTGGCVFGDVVSSVQHKLGQYYDAAYKHFWTACYAPNATYPILLKLAKFPAVKEKSIPGCLDSSKVMKSNYLHRIDGPEGDNNRDSITRPQCRWLWGSSVGGSSGNDCDEFPFASTWERWNNPYPGANLTRAGYSLCPIPAAENQKAGTLMTNFYARERLLVGDPFFVQFATELDGPEVCKSPILGHN
ncbi:DNRLRE domain-containing protein [Nonomuraea solani]|nr:DNRLRE domain-containing protein [Nonomuraea solani]